MPTPMTSASRCSLRPSARLCPTGCARSGHKAIASAGEQGRGAALICGVGVAVSSAGRLLAAFGGGWAVAVVSRLSPAKDKLKRTERADQQPGAGMAEIMGAPHAH